MTDAKERHLTVAERLFIFKDGIAICERMKKKNNSNIIPIHWTDQEIKLFRSKVKKHNQLVNFKIDPEIKRN